MLIYEMSSRRSQAGPIRTRPRIIRQGQRRLSAEAVERLKLDDLAGMKINELDEKAWDQPCNSDETHTCVE